MFRIKKTFTISAAHKLELDYESKCGNLHGHSWKIAVYCQSEELDKNGMVADFALIKYKVQDLLDHTSLSDVNCPKCGYQVISGSIIGINSTAENIAYWICTKIPKCYRVDVEEEEGSIATYIDDTLIFVPKLSI